jgi:hypothetical protein
VSCIVFVAGVMLCQSPAWSEAPVFEPTAIEMRMADKIEVRLNGEGPPAVEQEPRPTKWGILEREGKWRELQQLSRSAWDGLDLEKVTQ